MASGTASAAYAVTRNADGTMTVTLPATGTNGAAIALVQPTEDYGSLALSPNPASINSEDVADGSETITYTATYDAVARTSKPRSVRPVRPAETSP